jgi:YegS/Rv2252/BmrU family lipid kinase
MRRATLFYNPLSGRRRNRRQADVNAALRTLRDGGFEVSATQTLGSAQTPEQVRAAIAAGCDTIFACGGDGTIHDILQGIISTQAVLGIIPLGTANTLAHDLRIPFSATAAAKTALAAKPRRISVGCVHYTAFNGQKSSRYFVVTVGAGVDAHLFYRLNPIVKDRLGMAAYYVKATHLWFTHPLHSFEVEVSEQTATRKAIVSQLLAVRIRNFGGVLRELAPGASLERPDLRLVLFHTSNRVAYLRYILRGFFGLTMDIPGIELVHADRVTCRALPGEDAREARIFVEADGELLGTVPAQISMVPDALTLLA